MGCLSYTVYTVAPQLSTRAVDGSKLETLDIRSTRVRQQHGFGMSAVKFVACTRDHALSFILAPVCQGIMSIHSAGYQSTQDGMPIRGWGKVRREV
jgi:hypothetical protein